MGGVIYSFIYGHGHYDLKDQSRTVCGNQLEGNRGLFSACNIELPVAFCSVGPVQISIPRIIFY